MAAGIMVNLGEPVTCDEECNHRDCLLWRKMVGQACSVCGKPIQPGQRYYRNDKPLPDGAVTLSIDSYMDGLFDHAGCPERGGN
jgi:hypothetical protein